MPADQLSPDSKLEAIEIASLNIIEIVFALETKYDMAIPFNESAALAFETIGQVAKAVSKLVVNPA